MDKAAQNSIQIEAKTHPAISSLPVLELGKKEVGSAEEGWKAFLEMGEDGLGSKLHNASEEHDKYIYPNKKV